MPKRGELWAGWGMRLRAHIKKRKSNLAKVAEKMGRAESTLRSWTNGTRPIQLVEFFELCEAVDANPDVILFGSAMMSQEQHKLIRELATTIPPLSQPQ